MKKALKIGCLIFFVIPTILAILVAVFSDDIESSDIQENKTSEILNINPPTKKIDKPTINYKSLPLKRVGLNTQNRAIQRIVLDSDSIPSNEIIKRTALKHWRINSLRKFTEFTAFIYLEGMSTNDIAYAVVEFNSRGEVTLFKINDYSLMGTKWNN
jgi:hypothetical protein